MPLPRWTRPKHGRAGVLGELAERFERGADFAVAVGVDPPVHHRRERVEDEHGDVVGGDVGGERGHVDGGGEPDDDAVVFDLDAADEVKVGTGGEEPRDHGELPRVLTGGEHHPGRACRGGRRGVCRG